MPLDPSTLEKVHAWLARHAPNLACPVCQSKTWDAGEVGILMPFQNGKVVRSKVVYPLLPLICKQCAYTYLFSAVGMGLLGSGEPPTNA